MRLTLQELTAITKGCLSIRETSSGFLFQRMTDRQLAAVDHIERYRMRARFPAGVRFDFLTDASAISFDYKILEFDPNRNFFGVDLYVDGVMVHTLCEKPIAHKTGRFSCELGALAGGRTTRRIVLYLPISAIFAASDVVLRDAAQLERGPDGDGTLLCYGDSITQGYDAFHPSLGYAAILARSLGLDLLNQAISGYVFNPTTIDAAQVPAPPAHPRGLRHQRLDQQGLAGGGPPRHGPLFGRSGGCLSGVPDRPDPPYLAGRLPGGYGGGPLFPGAGGPGGLRPAAPPHSHLERTACRPPLYRILRRWATPSQRRWNAAIRPVAAAAAGG